MLFHLKTSGEKHWAEVPNFKENILTDIDSPNLVIPSGKQILQERSEYKIGAVVTLDNGFTIAEEMAFVTNSPPHVSDEQSGCSVTPNEGFVLTTEFNISCSGWTDDDLPLNYEFRSVSVTLMLSVVKLFQHYVKKIHIHSLSRFLTPLYRIT